MPNIRQQHGTPAETSSRPPWSQVLLRARIGSSTAVLRGLAETRFNNPGNALGSAATGNRRSRIG
jgi:hypothetical protein